VVAWLAVVVERVLVVMTASLPGSVSAERGGRYALSVGATPTGRPGRMTGFPAERSPERVAEANEAVLSRGTGQP